MSTSLSLSQLGWRPFFQQQLSVEEWQQVTVARVVEQHRSSLLLMTEQGEQSITVNTNMSGLTVGDWILLDEQAGFYRALDRLSLFSRKAAGTKVASQLIAANIDTLFVVCSMNQDFNLNRIERYLALANEAGVEPVVVLTKLDCCENPLDYVQQVRSLDPMLMVEAVNSLDESSVKVLEPWCQTGNTIALLGSSGVGKSTLVNTLMGQTAQVTHSIREDDEKGRHTTTARSLHWLPTGGILLDTPGMRELQLADCEQGINDTFSEISELAAQCQFTDCQHQGEPGCAVQSAIEAGQLDQRRLDSYAKLMREQAFNSASLAEKRARDRDLTRYYRSVQSASRRRKKS